ncbi:hypothetical protein NAEGRDRAFT_78467 [Naegleria gruberi]|uniref:F-box domain-containing protein n=1 Tax=Naegleria gruberi TaxID=5762 RepID=D2V3Z8_NAEGR|nr:uncharacterized protein NAEGRDRAFT_78467 [Naegleria gruberi]EFC48289.1 hypothetical protein NAEGRDRAFT_78467 [Naegleria gruberi]|eukprot:XP_002681033.1 hypothetical protein NAEGRDRAFT_78467 [Naegleria gruberi strain NEG-M]
MLLSQSSETSKNNQQLMKSQQKVADTCSILTRRLGLSSSSNNGRILIGGRECWINSTFSYSDESFIVNDDEEDCTVVNEQSNTALASSSSQDLHQGSDDHITESNMVFDDVSPNQFNDENNQITTSQSRGSTTQHETLDEFPEIQTIPNQTAGTLKTSLEPSRNSQSLFLDDLNDHHSHMMQLVKGVDAVARKNFNLAPSNLPDQHYLHHYIPENDDSLSTTKVRTLSDQGSEFSSERGDIDNEWFFNSCSNVNDSYFLPDELIYKILTYLDFDDVVLKSSLVNRQFFSVSNCGGFWIQFIKTRKCEDTVNILSYYQYEFHSNHIVKQIKHEPSEEVTLQENDDATTQNTDNPPNTPSDEIVIPSQQDSSNYDPANHLTIYRPILLSYLYHKRNLKKWFFFTEANYYLLFLLPFGIMTFLFLSSYVFPVFPPFYKLNLFSFSAAPSKFFAPSRRNIYIEGIGENFSQWTLGIFGASILVIIISLLLIRPLTKSALRQYSLSIQNEDQLSFTKSIITKTKLDYSSLIPHSTEMLPVSLRKKLVRDILGHEKLFTKEHVVRCMVLIPVVLCYITTVLKNFVYIPYLSETYHTLLSLPGYLVLAYLIKTHWYMVFKIHGFFSLLVCYACFHFVLNQLKWDVLIRPMFYFLSQVFGVWCYIILNFWVLGGPDNTQGIPCANS